MSEAVVDPPPATTRTSMHIREKSAQPVETPAIPAPGLAKGVPALKPVSATVDNNAGGKGKKVPKKRGRPKGSTKAAKVAKAAEAALALAAEEANAPVVPVEPDNPQASPPPYTPSVIQSEQPSVQEEDSAFEWNPQARGMSRAYQHMGEHPDAFNYPDSVLGAANEMETGVDSTRKSPGLSVDSNPVEPTLPILSRMLHAANTRPPSRQASNATNHPVSRDDEDRMGAIAPPDDEDLEPDVSLFVPKRVVKTKTVIRANTKCARPVSTDSASEGQAFEPYMELREIPYVIKIFNAMYHDTCSPTNWEANSTKWAIKSGYINQAQAGHALAQANAPLWAVKYADKPATTMPTMVLSAEAWEKVVKEINAREKAIYLAECEGRRSKPKSMLPLLVVKIEQEAPNRAPQSGKGGGRGWGGPRGPGSRDNQNPPGAFGGVQNAGHLRAILEGHNVSPYELDRGQRNDEPFFDGTLPAKQKSNEDCRELMLKRYRCTKHGPGAMCWVPGPSVGECIGEHIRIDGAVPSQLLITHMRANISFNVEKDNMPNAVATRLISMHLHYKRRGGQAAALSDEGPTAPTAPTALHGKHLVSGTSFVPPPHGPRLDQRLTDYPLVQVCLGNLEVDHPGKSFLRFANALISGVGTDTIGELIDLIYTDLRNGKYNANPTDALEDYIKTAMGSSPPRRLVMVMVRSFETKARAFEDDEFANDFAN